MEAAARDAAYSNSAVPSCASRESRRLGLLRVDGVPSGLAAETHPEMSIFIIVSNSQHDDCARATLS